jgi:hypothetical protein
MSTAINVIRLYAALQSAQIEPFYLTLRALYVGCLAIVGIGTIYAFLRRTPNALALATTFVGMVGMNCVLAVIMLFISPEREIIAYLINIVIWMVTWFVLLGFSYNMKVCFPKETRRWFIQERILLGLYIISFVIYGYGACTLLHDPLNNSFLTYEARTQYAVARLNKVYPSHKDGLHSDGFAIEGDSLCHRLHYSHYALTPFDRSRLAVFRAAERERTKYLYSITQGKEILACQQFFARHGYCFKTSLCDENGVTVCTTLFTPDEYAAARAIRQPFRCDPQAWQTVLETENALMPHPMFSFYQVTGMHLNDSCLLYDLTMPDYGPLALEKFTDPFMERMIRECLWSTYDVVWMMAKRDRRDVVLRFTRVNGTPHTVLTIPYSFYMYIE